MEEFSWFEKILVSLKELAKLLVKKDWAEKNAGNFSIRLDHFPKKLIPQFSQEEIQLTNSFPLITDKIFCVKEKGAKFRDIAKDPISGIGFIWMTNQGSSYRTFSLRPDSKSIIPTSELDSHLLIQNYFLEKNQGWNSILHTHPIDLIALTNLREYKNEDALNHILRSMHLEISLLFPQGVGFVKALHPGSWDLALATLGSLKKHSVIVWENHGCLAAGDSIWEAYDNIDIFNKAASIFLRTRKEEH